MKCQYKDLLGAAGTGVHQYRFLGSAVVDVVLTLVAAGLVTKFFKLPLELSIILLFSLGILAHVLFGVETSTLKYLGISC